MARARRCLAIGERLKQPLENQTQNRVIIAWIYYKLHNFEKSAEYFNQVMNSGNTEYYSYMARAALEIGQKTEGLKWAKKGLEHEKHMIDGIKNRQHSDGDQVASKQMVDEFKDIDLARAELILGMGYFANARASQAQALVDDANKLLSRYSEQSLARSEYVIREIFRDALEIRNELKHRTASASGR
jgi:tetratricopeptide (TPR) repeat protein